jgi:hypothetical protein
VKFPLADGTFAHLHAIVQTENYRRPYLEPPGDVLAEIERLARFNIPASWPTAPLLVIGLQHERLDELLLRGKSPRVLCVGEFVSYRKRGDENLKAVFLHVVWLQEELSPHMSEANQAAFRSIDFEANHENSGES